MSHTGQDTDPAVAPASGPDHEFQTHVADGKLWLQHCKDCDTAIFMPRVLCPSCASLALEWRPASGLGTIYSQATLRPRAKPGAPERPPHSVVLVDLDEGPRMMSHLPGVSPEDIHIGMRVRARIDGDTGSHLVAFFPEESQP
ncbi:Zn-ribbon domain-containing OB-fold protein [Shimia aestuarii]|uniref:Zn-ribbon domain-containing OB-fold protein n=1 Tax=Shimia aestuarii TaxID=254406 RepID=UPI001FB4CE4C|nr:OB-fold domain-containing protein [Shimia aestuarii]